MNQNGIVLNEDSISTLNFRVETDSNTHMLYVNAGQSKVGIGVSDPDSVLEVFGSSQQQKWSYDSNSFASLNVAIPDTFKDVAVVDVDTSRSIK